MSNSTAILVLVLAVLYVNAKHVKAVCVNETSYTPCPRCVYKTQDALDVCYMREALNFGKSLNPVRPFGALVVDTYSNTISCYGVNNNKLNALFHGEIAAMNNCTALFPSPTQNDRANPGLFWPNQTLYTTAESCPMCAAATVWRGVGRVVYGTDIPTLIRIGLDQITIRQSEVYEQSAILMYGKGYRGVPLLKGGVLNNETDPVFFTGASTLTYPSVLPNPAEDVFNENPPAPCGCGASHDDDD